jgi:regulator of RNase E activity RraA
LDPTRLDHQTHVNNVAQFGNETVTNDDYVFADEDGIAFVHKQYLKAVIESAVILSGKERKQADLVEKGTILYKQFAYDNFLEAKKINPGLSFRVYLRSIDAAIEE